MSLLEKAIKLAVIAHAGQIDEDGMPHIVHCFEVFHRVREMFEGSHAISNLPKPELTKYTQEEIEIAAILHDAVEDSKGYVTLERIEAQFGKNVRSIVDSVTRRGEGDMKEFYRDFIYRAKEDEGGILVKIADLSHNRSRAHKIKKASWRNKLEFKYATAMSVLNDANQPTWEQASWSAETDGPHTRYFVADPNGKKIEVTKDELFATLGRKANA